MIELKSKVTQKLLDYFFVNKNSSLYVNEIERFLNLDKRNLIKKLKALENEGILRSEYKGNQKYFSLNLKYPLINEYKKIFLKTIGFEKKVQELFKGLKGVKEAFIFGSYAKDKMDSSSDVDILVVGNHDTLELQKRTSKLQDDINREINVISMSTTEFNRKKKNKDPFISNILKKDKIRIL